MERIAIYPGSFDPVTNGHMDIVLRAARLFDHLVVTVAANTAKQPLFSADERCAMLRDACMTAGLTNVEVDRHDGLLVDYARARGAQTIIKGLRAVSDFEMELQMALTNRMLCPELETLFLMTHADYLFLASRTVREIAALGGDVSAMVPAGVEVLLYNKLRARQAPTSSEGA